MSNTLPSIVAHRGASEDAPENTLASFQLAWEQKADFIEGDFRLTSDGEIVCIHDKDTYRTTGTSSSIEKTTLADLQSLDAGSWKDPDFSGIGIPTLQEMLATVPDHGGVFIEVKCGSEIVPRLKAVLSECRFLDHRVRVISFSTEVIEAVRRDIPEVKTLWLTKYDIDIESGDRYPSTDDILATLRKTGADGLGSKAHESVDNALVGEIQKHGFEFHVWTVNDLVTAERFRHLGVESITTNRPGWLREQMKI